jgi:hypothetical protein
MCEAYEKSWPFYKKGCEEDNKGQVSDMGIPFPCLTKTLLVCRSFNDY